MFDHLPYDLRLNPNLFNHLKQLSVNVSPLERSSSLVNRLSLLEIEARRSYFEDKNHSTRTSLTGNLIQLSRAFHSGQVQLESLPHPVVVHLLPFFKLLASFLENCICQVDALSDKHYWMVVDGLTWRDRLWSVCEKQTRQNFSISVLSLHWDWFAQYTLNSIPLAFGILDHRELPGELVTVINHLKSILEADSRMAEAYLKILSAYGHPPPFRSRTFYQIWERLQHLCQRIDKHHNKSWMSVPEEKLLTSAEVRRKLAEVMRIILDNRLEFKEDGNQCGQPSRNGEAVKEQLEALTTYQPNRTSRDPETQAHYQHLQVVLPEGDNLNTNFCSIFQPVESEVLFKCFMLKSYNLWMQSNQEKHGHPQQDINSKESSVCCLLGGSQNLLESISSKKLVEETHYGSLTSITISNYHENMQQLQLLSNHIWVNGDVLDSCNEVDRRSSIKLFISKLIHVLLSMKGTLPLNNHLHITSVADTFLDVVTSENGLDGIVAAVNALISVVLSVANSYKEATGDVKQADLIFNLLKECLEGMAHLQQGASEDTKEMLWDSICRGSMWVKLGLVHSLILSPVGLVDPVEKTSIELQHVNKTIQKIEEELKVRYFAEEIWTGLKTGAEKLEALLLQESWSKTELTSNPYRVQWLLTKLKVLRVQAQTLDKNSAFRPTISQ
ncbi:AAA ATPase midasin, partial [Desmophyllum pertusum]